MLDFGLKKFLLRDWERICPERERPRGKFCSLFTLLREFDRWVKWVSCEWILRFGS